jgi:hypothetical protein
LDIKDIRRTEVATLVGEEEIVKTPPKMLTWADMPHERDPTTADVSTVAAIPPGTIVTSVATTEPEQGLDAENDTEKTSDSFVGRLDPEMKID